MIIGIDFDNTIASYDTLMSTLAVEAGLIEKGLILSKQHIRDTLRALPQGEAAWQRMQATTYGTRMNEAELMPGVIDFFRATHRQNIPFIIISHKSERAAADTGDINLRQAAHAWMTAHNFFTDPTLSPTSVFFESTRKNKIERIRATRCTHFIDDLVETFNEPTFPADVAKILFSAKTPQKLPASTYHAASWATITTYLFGEAT